MEKVSGERNRIMKAQVGWIESGWEQEGLG